SLLSPGAKPLAVAPAAHIYAPGALLYEMHTGRPPFRAETAAETERQVLAEEPVPPAQLNPKVPRDLETICLKCLHKDPQRRYANAGALAEDVRRFVEGRPIQARPSSSLGGGWRGGRASPPGGAAAGEGPAPGGLCVRGAARGADRGRAQARAGAPGNRGGAEAPGGPATARTLGGCAVGAHSGRDSSVRRRIGRAAAAARSGAFRARPGDPGRGGGPGAR